MLGSVKLDPFEVKSALLQVDTLKLTEILLTNLLNHVPTDEEAGALKAHHDDPKQLAAPDFFLFVLMGVPRLEHRLRSIIFLNNFDTKLAELVRVTDFVKTACDSLVKSTRLNKLVELVLVLGNYMNGAQRATAHGFKISSLNKLADLKSADNKRTLLQYVVSVVEKKFPSVDGLPQELAFCKEASRSSDFLFFASFCFTLLAPTQLFSSLQQFLWTSSVASSQS